MTELQQTKLWQDGLMDVKIIADDLKRNINPKPKDVLFTTYFPKISFVIEHFLANSDDVKYSTTATPRSLATILQRYQTTANDDRGGFVRGKTSDCSIIHSHILNGNYSQEFVLSSINTDLRDRWKEFQDTMKLRTSDVELVERTLKHFLANSDDVKYSANAIPRSLKTILQRYQTAANNEKGGFVKTDGSCSSIYSRILNGNYSQEFVLSSINTDLRDRWKEFRDTMKLRTSDVESVERTLEHFLANSDDVRYFANSNPRLLANIIQGYKTATNNGKGDFVKEGISNCNPVYQHIKSGNYSQEFVLSSVNLDLWFRWKEFEDTMKLRTSDVESVERTLEHFLANSDDVRYLPNAKPRLLKSVIKSYKSHNRKKGEIVRENGDCDAIYSHILNGNYSQEFVLSSINTDLRDRWKEFQDTMKLRTSDVESVERTLKHFLANSDDVKYSYSTTNNPRSLKTVLQRYQTAANNEKGGFVNKKNGDCNAIFTNIKRENYSFEFLLSSINPELRNKWEEFHPLTEEYSLG